MIHPHLTFDHLSKLLSQLKLTQLEGRFFRLVPQIHAEAIEETGPSFIYGGRYNPAGEFGGLYLSESSKLCWDEIIRPYLGREDIIPDQALGEFQVRIGKCLDLTDEAIIGKLGIKKEDITDSIDRYLTQMIGRVAWSLGIEAIKFPSSASPGQFNVVVFRDHLSEKSELNRVSVSSFKKG